MLLKGYKYLLLYFWNILVLAWIFFNCEGFDVLHLACFNDWRGIVACLLALYNAQDLRLKNSNLIRIKGGYMVLRLQHQNKWWWKCQGSLSVCVIEEDMRLCLLFNEFTPNKDSETIGSCSLHCLQRLDYEVLIQFFEGGVIWTD